MTLRPIVFDSGRRLLAALLLLAPGFLSDVFALFLLLIPEPQQSPNPRPSSPAGRKRWMASIGGWSKRRSFSSTTSGHFGRSPRSGSQPNRSKFPGVDLRSAVQPIALEISRAARSGWSQPPCPGRTPEPALLRIVTSSEAVSGQC